MVVVEAARQKGESLPFTEEVRSLRADLEVTRARMRCGRWDTLRTQCAELSRCVAECMQEPLPVVPVASTAAAIVAPAAAAEVAAVAVATSPRQRNPSRRRGLNVPSSSSQAPEAVETFPVSAAGRMAPTGSSSNIFAMQRHKAPLAAASAGSSSLRAGSVETRSCVHIEGFDGAWTSDCGPILILRGEVRDAGGMVAPLAFAADGRLELSFAGELWRSAHVDHDRIVWEGDGGTWVRTPPDLLRPASRPSEQGRYTRDKIARPMEAAGPTPQLPASCPPHPSQERLLSSRQEELGAAATTTSKPLVAVPVEAVDPEASCSSAVAIPVQTVGMTPTPETAALGTSSLAVEVLVETVRGTPSHQRLRYDTKSPDATWSPLPRHTPPPSSQRSCSPASSASILAPPPPPPPWSWQPHPLSSPPSQLSVMWPSPPLTEASPPSRLTSAAAHPPPPPYGGLPGTAPVPSQLPPRLCTFGTAAIGATAFGTTAFCAEPPSPAAAAAGQPPTMVSPQVAVLQAKVDYLSRTVQQLHGDILRMQRDDDNGRNGRGQGRGSRPYHHSHHSKSRRVNETSSSCSPRGWSTGLADLCPAVAMGRSRKAAPTRQHVNFMPQLGAAR